MSGLIPWREEMERLRSDLERLYDRVLDPRTFRRFTQEGEWMPSVDVSETAKEIIVKVEVPGVEAKEIDVNLDGNVLTIKGERKREHEERDENFHRIERSYGSFYRSLQLPAEVEGDKIKATYKKGVLKVTLPKSKKAAGKKIEVAAG
ncbi:MAG: Hsp20/alpha crystallin family protein [Deltaproteobacteria bacterium]